MTAGDFPLSPLVYYTMRTRPKRDTAHTASLSLRGAPRELKPISDRRFSRVIAEREASFVGSFFGRHDGRSKSVVVR